MSNTKSIIHIFSKDQTQSTFIGAIDNRSYAHIKRFTRIAQHHDLEINFKKILYNRGWITLPTDKTIEDIDLNIDNSPAGDIHRLILNSHIPVPFLADLFRAQCEQFSKFDKLYKNLLNQQGIFNIRDYLKQSISALLGKDYQSEVSQFIDATWDIRTIVNGTNIGRGEVCLTLLTGAIKADVGDLKVFDNTRKVEMKGSGGKAGSELFADNTAQRLAPILSMSTTQFQRWFIEQRERLFLFEQKTKLSIELRERKQIIQKKLSEAELQLNGEIAIRDNKKIPNSIIRALTNIQSTKQFIQIPNDNVISCIGTKVSSSELRVIKNITKELELLNKKKLVIDPHMDRKFRFNQAIHGFFLNRYFKPDAHQLMCGFYECRNHSLSNTQLSDLTDTIYKFFTINPVEDLRTYNGLGKLMMTLHILCYWLNNDFTDLHFTNDETKSSLILHLPRDNNSIDFMFNSIYNQIPEALTTNLQLGGQNPCGVEIRLEV